MATRAATFTAKIRNLKDYHNRMINNASPVPSGVDIANTLKYFSQTLLSVLKDVPAIPAESYGPRQRDSVRLSVFPNLNYSGVYAAVMNILDVVPMVQHGQIAFEDNYPVTALGEAILNVLGCLVPFLEYDLLDSLPYSIAMSLAMFPAALHREIIELLCTTLLPVTLGYLGINENPTYATNSTSSILMMVFQFVENGEYHSQLLECLMSMKKNICKDLLCVIAHGPPACRGPAVMHLFHYWPNLNPAITDRTGIHYKYTAWQPILCQRENCPNSGSTKAVKMCLDPAIAIQCGDKPPPLYICIDCCDQLRREHSDYLVDILQPLEKVSLTCENKNCVSGQQNEAVCTCFSIECASFNRNRPIRYCASCHNLKHSTESGANHVFHVNLPEVWSCDAELQVYLVEAIISLLKEAQPIEEKRSVEMGEARQGHYEEDEDTEAEVMDDRKLLSRYGIWLLVELCHVKEDISVEILGRLLAMLFQWFDATAYLPDAKNTIDTIGGALEKLKPEYICKWLKDISGKHIEVVLSCLLPHPVEYARVGGHWDTLSSRTSQIKEGLNRLFCLIPYNIVTFEVWDYIMPYWLEAIRTEVPEEELSELKVLISKTFDMDMCPLPFNTEMMYRFISDRFDTAPAPVQEQALSWLQILSMLEVMIPMNLLLSMFKMGVKSLQNPMPPEDIHRQSSLLNLAAEGGGNLPVEDVFPGSPLSATNESKFKFKQGDPLPKEKEMNVTCYLMMMDVIIKQCEVQEAPVHQGVQNQTCKDILELLTGMLNSHWDGEHTCGKSADEEVVTCLTCEMCSLWHEIVVQVVTFVVPKDEVSVPEKDLPKVEEVKGAPRSVSDPKERHFSKPGKEEEEKDRLLEANVSSMPVELQFLFALLKELDQQEDSSAIFHLLETLKLMCLHGNCLNLSVKNNEAFVRLCLRKYLVPNMWKLLQADHSYLAALCVPILLHALTVPGGADVLWQLVEEDFSSQEWHRRFSAVEKVTVFAREVTSSGIHNNQLIMTAIAHAFCHLINALNDTNSAVTQKTALYLETIKQSAIKCLCKCMEFQFDSVIDDRTMILQRMYQLSIFLKDQDIFSWGFFLNRFDTLSLEAQLDLEGTGEISCLTDLTSSDRQSEHFLRKINRARFALARTDSIRSLSGSFYKRPYRRAASVPLHLLAKTSASATKGSNTGGSEEDNVSRVRQLFGHLIHPAGGQLREFTDQESNLAALLQRAMDLEGVDRETVHLLIVLLMKYMTEEDQDKVNEDTDLSRAQNVVLRHLNVLLGYSQTEKAFSVPPYKLRSSTVFNAFLSNLPGVLDKNFSLGNIILPVSMALLQYCPSPQRYASDYQPPNYTLWLLDPHIRQSWLQALLVILYKYQYNSSPASGIIQTLVRIVVNTIDAQLHRCKRPDDTFGPASPMIPRGRGRSRDTSNVSVGDLENIQETETPPASPTDTSGPMSADGVTIVAPLGGIVQYKKRTDKSDSEDADDTPPPTGRRAALAVLPLDGTPTGSRKHKEKRRPAKSAPTLPPTFEARSPDVKAVSSPTEEIAKLGAGQSRRLAEYQADSLLEVRPEVIEAAEGAGSTGKEAPYEFKSPIKQRTFEESVEEYVLQQVGAHAKDGTDEGRRDGEPPGGSTSDVDRKIAEQIQAFESESGAKKKDTTPGTSGKPVDGTTSVPDVVIQDKSTEEKEVAKIEVTSEDAGRSKLELPLPLQMPTVPEDKPTVPVVLPDIPETDPDEEEQGKAVAHKGRRKPLPITGIREEGQDNTQTESDMDESPCPSPGPLPRPRPNFRQRKARKTGLTTVELHRAIPELQESTSSESSKKSPASRRRMRKSDLLQKGQQGSTMKRSMAALKYAESIMVDRCPQCHAVLEQYDEDTISLCIISLATFIHRESALAAPILPDMIQAVARIASSSQYPWQSDIGSLIIPGNSVSVARQFMRCTLHQLAPNGIFAQLFMTEIENPDFLKTLAAALVDFNELNCYAALQHLLEGVNAMKTWTHETMMILVGNMSAYLDCIALETSSPAWGAILVEFETFFRRLPVWLPSPCDINPVLKIMVAILKIPSITSAKGILEPFSKVLSFAIQNCAFKLQYLLDICSLCSRAFTKDRDKLLLCRCIIFELVSALKFRSCLPDENLLILVQFVCMDAGGTLGQTNIVEDFSSWYNPHTQTLISTNAAECMKQHQGDCVDFIADLHTINRVKETTGLKTLLIRNNLKGGATNLNEDTLGSQLKAGIAQYIALEFTRGNGRDNRAINRYMPWLYHPPSSIQQGPKEFIECVGHIRLLSWLLVGSLMHTAITKSTGPIICQPIPLEASAHIADHIMVIMSGFAEQSKASVLHMSSLFHAFILCQLWTMYCEAYAALHSPSSENNIQSHMTVMDFWGRVTPGVLQLLSHSKVLAEMVNLHFLGLMEALQECNSTVLAKLFPVWIPILYAYHNQLPGHLQVRLQKVQNWEPPEVPEDTREADLQFDSKVLLKWLKRLQFKLGQIEVQSSAATQFYTV